MFRIKFSRVARKIVCSFYTTGELASWSSERLCQWLESKGDHFVPLLDVVRNSGSEGEDFIKNTYEIVFVGCFL